MRETARWTLPLSFRSCVPFREIRLCDVDGVGDFFGVPGSAFGCGPAGGSLAALTVAGQGEDRGVQAGQRGIRAGGAVAAVPAAGVGGDVGADEAEHGGERDKAGVEAGGSGGAGGGGGHDVVDEQQCPGFLAGEFGGLAAQRAAGAADRLLEVEERDFDGLITNGKFCCVRRVQLSLTWWRRPLRLRRSALHTDVALVGEFDDPDLDRLPPVQPAPGRRAPVGSGLPAAGASGRAGRPARPDADRRGGR